MNNKKYTRQQATAELWRMDWAELFKLFKTPAGTFKQMHDHAIKVLYHVSKTFANMPQKLFREAGNLQAAVNAAYTFNAATC